MTTSTTTYSPGDVVLVRFPFTDLTQHKLRPAVVVCPDAYVTRFRDVVLVALTSPPQVAGLTLTRWREAGLPKATWVKPLVMTLSRSTVVKKIGTLQTEDSDAVKAATHTMVAVTSR